MADSKFSYSAYEKAKRGYYENMLRTVCSLSRLFSESAIPYLDSRVAENLYCKSFSADNKSRDDTSIDAVYRKTGIGIKTFAGSGSQKIAEFNKDLLQFSSLPAPEKTRKIAELRNIRIDFAKRNYALDNLHYHCIRREKGKLVICEYSMDLIDISKIRIIKSTSKIIR